MLIFLPAKVFAGDSPVTLSPINNSTVASTKLTWEKPSYTLYSSSPFRVQVDDDSNFGSIEKDYYTANTYYTPALNEGVWYWKVKVKDSSGIWSDWSGVQKFTFTLTQTTPSPSPTQEPTPTPAPTQTTAPTPTPSPASTPTPTARPSLFTLSNTLSQISSSQSFNISVSLSLPDNPNTKFYLKGLSRKQIVQTILV